MTDRPIIFSGPMVRALLAGRKTQTRRLATSPLRRCQPGDRLYVREAWRTLQKWEGIKPSQLMDDPSKITFEADPENRRELWAFGRAKPGMHMPRWASRLTLILDAVRVEPLQAISALDAIAEGLKTVPFSPFEGEPAMDAYTYHDGDDFPHAFPTAAYEELWNTLHTAEGERWQDNPDVLVLTFRVVRGNIDRLEQK